MKDWPSDDGEEYVAAVKACVDAITGNISPEQFREILLRAANEARYCCSNCRPSRIGTDAT